MIVQYNLLNQKIGEFASTIEAQKKTGIKSGDIKRCLSGDRKTAGDCRWKNTGERSSNGMNIASSDLWKYTLDGIAAGNMQASMTSEQWQKLIDSMNAMAESKPAGIRKRAKKKELPRPYTKGDKRNVLVIADSHLPFCREGYLEHCRSIQEQYECGTVVHIGDEVDLCAISQWERDPDGFSAGSEAEMAQEQLYDWYEVFPEVKVCIGNHTARPFRMARTAGIPNKFIKAYEEAWNAPEGWKWADNWEIESVLYTHGTGLTGDKAAINLASQSRQNCVIGHIHTCAGIQYNASKKDLVWGMMVGGATDDKAYAFAYAKDQIKKSIVGCGVVLGGKLPIYIPMSL